MRTEKEELNRQLMNRLIESAEFPNIQEKVKKFKIKELCKDIISSTEN